MSERLSALFTIFATFAALLARPAVAEEILVGDVRMPHAPAWLSSPRVAAVVSHVTAFLSAEPDEVTVLFYPTEAAFHAAVPLQDWVLAVHIGRISAHGQTSTIALGPEVNTGNFEHVFGHELTHALIFQHYKGAIPKWLEEGLANYIGGGHTVDYHWLAAQGRVPVRTLVHNDISAGDARFKYMTSTAVIEMLASRCSLHDLLQYSKGVDLESNLESRCNVKDVDQDFGHWLAQKTQSHALASVSFERAGKPKLPAQPAKTRTAAPSAPPIQSGGADSVDFTPSH